MRADTVEERGTFSVRGGLIDVFPTTGREPVRAEFFGDEVERLSAFSAFTQRSLRELDRTVLHPAAEPDQLEQRWGAEEDEPSIPAGLVALAPELERLAQVIVWNPDAVAAAVRERAEEVADRLHDPDMRGRGYLRPEQVQELIERAGALEELPLGQTHSFEAQTPALASFGIAEAENELRALVRAGYRVLVCFPHLGEAGAAAAGADADRGGAAGARRRRPAGGRRGLLPGRHPRRRGDSRGCGWRCCRPRSCSGGGRRGGRWGWAGRWPPSATCGRATTWCTTITASAASSASTPREVAGVVRDYLYLEFRGDDRLYVPHEQLGKVSRYIGADGSAPALAKLGGKAWHNLKARARVAVRELAGELLALYARRQAVSRDRRSRTTTSGRRGWRRRSPTRRPTTSSARSTPSPTTWRPSSRWTGWSAATSASARPRWRCGRP